jgi:hypothetical protein
VTLIALGLSGLAAAAVIAVGLAGVLSEAHRAPDQP